MTGNLETGSEHTEQSRQATPQESVLEQQVNLETLTENEVLKLLGQMQNATLITMAMYMSALAHHPEQVKSLKERYIKILTSCQEMCAHLLQVSQHPVHRAVVQAYMESNSEVLEKLGAPDIF